MSFRTTAQINSFIEKTQHRMDVPQQLYGDEPNSYGERAGGPKGWDKSLDPETGAYVETHLRACIFACWAYEQAAGNQAIPLVYKVINEHRPDILCDRTYFPSTPRDLRLMEKAGIPIFGIEHRHQLMDYDVIGTSISYPVLAINFVKQLEMSDIPCTWEDRYDPLTGKTHAGRYREPERWPMVVVGGQGFGAPEVLANIADAVFCGEAEDEPGQPGVGAMFGRIVVMKEQGRWQTDRMSCYADLAKEFPFMYFPTFVETVYDYEDRPSVNKIVGFFAGQGTDRFAEADKPVTKKSKQVVGFISKLPGLRIPIVKRFVRDLDAVPVLDNPPLLYEDPGMGAGDLETQRGCPAWCSFCALTYRQKPYRQRSVDFMVEFGKSLTKNTGGVHVAPFGPDFPMHTQKKLLIKSILENVTDDVDASSMRVDDFIADPSYILLQAHGGMDTVTLGVEGNSQRMRDLVGKGAADEDVKEAVARGIRAGIRKFKLYMIASLPGEDEGDIYRILNLAKELADIRDSLGSTARIQFSWTPLLIEGNTPFQWFSPTASNYALGDVWEEFRDIKIDFKLGGKAQKDKINFFQATQRASREVGKAMVEAVAATNSGCWGGAPRGLFESMEESLIRHGFLNGIADVYDERQKHDMFGWEHIDQGINVELMWVTYQQMKEFLENTDSATYDENFGDDYHGNEWIERCDTKCYGKTCGVCSVDDLKIRRGYIQGAAEEISVDLNKVAVIDERTVAMKVRAKVVKSDDKRFVENNHFRYAIRRAARRAGVPITKRTVKFSSDAMKFKDWTSGADFVEFALTSKRTGAELKKLIELMNVELGSAMQIVDFDIFPASTDALREDVDLSLFEMQIDTDVHATLEAIRKWNDADEVMMVFKDESRQLGIVREEVNGKDYVDDMWLVRDGHSLMIRMLCRGKANPYIVYAALFGKNSWVEAAEHPAVRMEAFLETDATQVDFFRPVCATCGLSIPVNLLDRPYDQDFCPRHLDDEEGRTVEMSYA